MLLEFQEEDIGYEGKIVYAVDADVFAMLGGMHSDVVQDFGYSNVYADTAPLAAAGVSFHLTRHIFSLKDTNDIPKIILPSIQAEYVDIMRYVINDVLGGTMLPKMDVVDSIRQKHKNGQNITQDDIQNLAEAIVAIRGSQIFKRRKLFEAIDEKVVIPFEEFRKKNHLSDPALALLGRMTEDEWLDELQKETTRWISLFRESVSGKKGSRVNLLRDASALAWISIANRLLGKLDKNEKRVRICYITGTPRIFYAALSLLGSKNKDDREYGNLFLRKILRHPRSFLNILPTQISVNEKENGGTDEDASLLNGSEPRRSHSDNSIENFGVTTLFSASIGAGRFSDYLPFLSEDFTLSEKGKELYENKEIEAKSQRVKKLWDIYCTSLAATYNAEECGGKGTGCTVGQKGALDSVNSLLYEIDELFSAVAGAWKECFELASETGRLVIYLQNSSLKNDGGRETKSSVSTFILRCTESKEIQNVINDMSEWHRRGDYTRYSEKMDLIQQHDPSNYIFWLVNGVLYAGQGLWSTARAMAKIAIAIARVGVNKDSTFPIRGREAYYFYALCSRRSARSVTELDDIDSYIGTAEEIFKGELRSGDPQYLGVIPERFEQERLAVKMCRMLFNVFDSQDTDRGEEKYKTEWADIRDTAFKIIKAIDEKLDDVKSTESNAIDEKLGDVKSTESVDYGKLLLERTKYRIAIILVQIYIHSSVDLRDLSSDEGFKSVAKIVQEWDFDKHNRHLWASTSAFDDGIKKCVMAIMERRMRDIEDVFDYFSPEKTKKFSIYPFCKKQFEDIVKKVRNLPRCDE